MGLFKSKTQRKLEREIKARRGKTRIKRFIKSTEKVRKRYWDLARDALRLGDREQFRPLAAAYVRADQQVNRWRRYLLQLETLQVRQREVSATGEFLESVSAMTSSMLRGADAEQVAAMQANLEEALARSRAVEDMLSVALDASADSIFGTEELDEGQLEELSQVMLADEEEQDEVRGEQPIAAGLREIEREMRREME